MNKEEVTKLIKEIVYHLNYFKTTKDEARVYEALWRAERVLQELEKE